MLEELGNTDLMGNNDAIFMFWNNCLQYAILAPLWSTMSAYSAAFVANTRHHADASRGHRTLEQRYAFLNFRAEERFENAG